MKKKNSKPIKNWDNTTKAILGISTVIIIFAFTAPLIFTSPAPYDNFNFTETGPIGDTIGGLLSPFIALAGVFLTFLAFYMQIKANEIQIRQFQEGLTREKENREKQEQKDYFNKMSLLKTDLISIKKDIEQKAQNIKEYYELEKKYPFASNLLPRTASKKYSRILEIDRLSIYKGFELYLNERKDWVKDFSNLYNILDFLPALFESIYEKYDYHSKDIYNKKMQIRDQFIVLMDELSKIINKYLEENDKETYLNFPVTKLANETILKYYQILNESYDENGNPVKETDFIKIDEEVLKHFNQEALKLRSEQVNYDVRIEPIVELISNMRKQLSLIKEKSIEFANGLESQYKDLMINQDDNKAYYTLIDEIENILEEKLEQN